MTAGLAGPRGPAARGARVWRAGVLACGLAAAADAAPADALIEVPSGQSIRLQDVIWNAPSAVGLAVRFRFVAPQIARQGGDVDFETAAADMEHLCNSYALPRVLTITGPVPEQIIVSLSDVPVEFGVMTPEATQFFEAYSIADELCIWEEF